MERQFAIFINDFLQKKLCGTTICKISKKKVDIFSCLLLHIEAEKIVKQVFFTFGTNLLNHN